jgi:sulfite reductase alpha subunit-like flavoprotein
MILVCAGTGVAPMRGFLWERLLDAGGYECVCGS